MEKERIKIGIMGARMGEDHALCFQALKKDVAITAVCEQDTSLHADMYDCVEPDAKFYTDFDEFIKSGIDAVVLANYFDEHAKYAIKAFEAGVDVMSETTAAPSLAECVMLVEAAEKYGRKYALGMNCQFFRAVYNMKKRIDEGSVGKVLFGEAEYLHESEEVSIDSDLVINGMKKVDLEDLHWRQTLPPPYYNMHTLGPLMYVSNTMPKTVYCSAIHAPDYCKKRGTKMTDCPGAVVITKMDNGAVFKSTGCDNLKPTSKWYRINCEKGCMETERYEYREEKFIYGIRADYQESSYPGPDESGLSNDEIKEIEAHANTNHHGGINFYTAYHFVKYLQGVEDSDFDVYKAVTLSAVGILAWYSVLTGKEFRIPDFRNPEDREKVRYDTRKPFAKRYEDLTLPCRLDEKDKFDLYDEKYKFKL